MNGLSPDQLVWPLISVLSSVAVIVSVIVAVIKLNRRAPPLPEELAKNYATKVEVSEVHKRLSDRIDREIRLICENNADHNRKLDSLISTTNHSALETQRALGRIEGKLDSHLEQH